MPIYEFRCDSCENKFEKLCRIGQDQGMTCPDCGGPAPRILSTFFSRSVGSDGCTHSHGGCSCGSGGCSGGDCSNCTCH